jgi:glycosyltransferase involved in cell wall biosynthesis
MTAVIWWGTEPGVYARGYWDQGIIEGLLAGAVWAWRAPTLPMEWEHYATAQEVPESEDGAIVVFPARWYATQVEQINAALARFQWVLVLLCGDEEGEFPYERLTHPNMKVWVQTPHEGRHDRADRRIGDGFPPQAPGILDTFDPAERRTQGWFFAGQLNNARREECIQALQARRDSHHDGRTRVTRIFGSGFDYPDYLREMAASKVIPCPSGTYSPDTFRLFEALEAGCVPIADTSAPNTPDERGYWRYLFGEEPPFPVLEDWADFGVTVEQVLDDWPAQAARCHAWWQGKKREMAWWLADDLATLKANASTSTGDTNTPIEGPQGPASEGERCNDSSGEAGPSGPVSLVPAAVTVLMPTSVIPAHPSIDVIAETIDSIRAQTELGDCEILVMVDGLRPEQEDRRADYDEYRRRLAWATNHRWRNVLPIMFDEYTHQAAMTRATLDRVRSDCVLFVEHDTPIVGQVDWSALVRAVRSGQAHTIRLHHEARIQPEHQHLMLDTAPVDVEGAPLMRTVQWSQRPHLSGTEHYRWLMADYFGAKARTMIEDVLHGVVHNRWMKRGITRGWGEFKLWLYAPEGDLKRSTHTDGRGTDPKYGMTWEYDGPTPEGAPNPRDETVYGGRHLRLGIICRSENRGLGIQSADLVRHLKPDKALVVDMGDISPYPMHLERFPGAAVFEFKGSDLTCSDQQLELWLGGLDVVITAETPYAYRIYDLAAKLGVKTACIYNFEFFRYFADHDLPRPDLFIAPSTWHIDEVPDAVHVPHGIDRSRFPYEHRTEVRSFLHVLGHPAGHDRAGTTVLIDALYIVEQPTRLVVRAQQMPTLPRRFPSHIELDLRVEDVRDNRRLYDDGDVVIAPRRYGGQSLPMMEALSRGMPVLMPDAEPNRSILPAEMLIECQTYRSFRCQAGRVDLHDTDASSLAERMDRLQTDPDLMGRMSAEADRIAAEHEWKVLLPRYHALFESMLGF